MLNPYIYDKYTYMHICMHICFLTLQIIPYEYFWISSWKVSYLIIFAMFPTTLPRFISFPTHPTLCRFFFLLLQNQFVLATQSKTCGLLVNNVLLTKDYSSRENQPFIPQQLTIVSSVNLGVGSCAQLLSLCYFLVWLGLTQILYILLLLLETCMCSCSCPVVTRRK